MRHFEVDFKWRNYCNSAEFIIDYNAYNTRPIRAQKTKDFKPNISRVYLSTMSRTQETYLLLGLENEAIKTNLLNEVPMQPFMNSRIKLPTKLWKIIARLQWYFNHKRQPETRNKTLTRIKQFLDVVEKDNTDCLVIGHGVYFSQMVKVLLDNNYKGNSKRIYKNGEVIMFTSTNELS